MWAPKISLEELKGIVNESIKYLDGRHFWMLTWVDKIALSDDGTPYFKASVHRVKSINLTHFKIENLDLIDRQWITLPLRLLRIFPVGTLFKSGIVMFKSHLGYIADFTIDLNTASSYERVTMSNWKYGEAIIKAMAWHKLDGFPKSESTRFAANSNILVYPNSKRPSADYDFVIFPTSELARFYWFPSTRLFRALMDGEASSDLKNELYVPESAEKKFEDGKEYHEILLRDTMHLRDAEFIARLAFSSDALGSANTLYQSVINSKLESGNKGSLHLDCIFPFNDDTTLKVKGYTIKLDIVSVLIVTEFIQCHGPWPFERLKYDRETPQGEVDESMEKQGSMTVPSEKTDQPELNIDEDEEEDIEDEYEDFVLKRNSFLKGDRSFDNTQKNNNRTVNVELTDKGSRFPTMPKDKKRLQRRRKVPPKNIRESDPIPIDNISTNENTKSGGNSTNIDIVSEEEKEKAPRQVELATFIEQLAKALRKKGALVDFVVSIEESNIDSKSWYLPEALPMTIALEGDREVQVYIMLIRLHEREYILCEMNLDTTTKIVFKHKLKEDGTTNFIGADMSIIVTAIKENYKMMGKLNVSKSGFRVSRIYHMGDTEKKLCERIITKVENEKYTND